jgi:hypothetical protein
MRRRPRGRRRSVDRGEHRPAIEPRNGLTPGADGVPKSEGNTDGRDSRECLDDPAWSETLACADASSTGTGRSRVSTVQPSCRSASGRRGAEADDARPREVRLRHSSCEAGEQSIGVQTRCRGVGGARGGDREEHGEQNMRRTLSRTTHVTGARSCTAPRSRQTHGRSRMP